MQRGKTSRKTHNKTRTGCQTCKKRKIKCDETRPSCQNCIKHDVQCYFGISRPQRGSSSENSATSLDSRAPSQCLSSLNSTSQYQTGTQSPFRTLAPSALPLAELRLLHNFCCATCYTLSPNEALRTLWRINVPQLGFTHDFVMRGILALSALHLAHLHGNKHGDYFTEAATHQKAALDAAMPLLNDLTVGNCPGLYMFSIQTVIYALGSPRKPGDLLIVGSTNVVPDWLYLLRGTKFIIEFFTPSLHASVVAPMFHIGRRRSDRLRAAVSKERHLEELRAQIMETVDKSMSEVYNNTIDELQQTFAVACDLQNGTFDFKPTDVDLYDVFTWPYMVADEYLSCLKKLEPAALAILAHFCVLLKALDGHWWMQGWSTHLINTIFSSLDAEHRLWIQWPIEEIGLSYD